MNGISSWIMAVVGISVLGVLVDLVMPDGQTKKYIKGVFAFIVVLVIISPLPSLLNKEFSINDIFEENAIVIQEDFVYQVNRDRLETLENMIEADLKEQGISNISIKISANIFTNKMKIEAVFVDLSQVVINQNLEHIDINELVAKSVLKYVSIEKNNIVIN
ncbi:MAG: stage III sporulation protein AF [Eubacteriales bacterium]|nr:stage III sporulation protein AF [Eubacteriales bacterium]